MHGEDVKWLHEALMQLSFDIPESELAESVFGQATERAVRRFQRQHHLDPTGVVDGRTAALVNRIVEGERPQPQGSFVVKGRVVQANGKPLAAGLVVRAYEKDLCGEKLLGETETDEKGYYVIRYGPEQSRPPERGAADLRVYACTEDGRQVAISPILFNVGAEETVDLVVGGEVSRGP